MIVLVRVPSQSGPWSNDKEEVLHTSSISRNTVLWVFVCLPMKTVAQDLFMMGAEHKPNLKYTASTKIPWPCRQAINPTLLKQVKAWMDGPEVKGMLVSAA